MIRCPRCERSVPLDKAWHSKRVQRVRQRAMEMADRPGSDDQFEDWLGAGDLWRMADEREEAERRLARGRR